jgi:hypothetical protein
MCSAPYDGYRRLGERGIQHRDGPHCGGSFGASRGRDRPDLHGGSLRSSTGWLRLRQFALRDFRRRFPGQDDHHPADKRRHTGDCRGWKPSRPALRGLFGHRRGDRPRPSLGFTRSCLACRDGRKRIETNRRRRTLSRPPSKSARRQTGRCRCHSATDFGRWRSRTLPRSGPVPSIKIPKYQYVGLDSSSWARCGKKRVGDWTRGSGGSTAPCDWVAG